jgi:cytochrome c oxidase subunit II
MHSKTFQFVIGIGLLACTILATRVYEVDAPLWRLVHGGKTVDASTLHLEGEFVESNLGSQRDSDGSITLRMIAQQYDFVPSCVVVPAQVPVHLRITSADAVHLLTIAGTDIAVKAVPGTISESVFKLNRTGEFELPCHEFCGAGHYAMRAHMTAVPEAQFPALGEKERASCGGTRQQIPSNVAWTDETIQQATSGDALRGLLISRRCERCHGQEGFSMSPSIPNLASMNQLVIWKQLEDFRSDKRKSEVMEKIASALSSRDSADLAAYYSLLPNSPDPQDNRAFPEAVSDSEKLAVASRLISLGDGRRGIPPCQACHGPVAYVSGVPSLATQNADYILRELEQFSDESRSNDLNLRMRSIASQLSENEKRALADYYGAGRGNLPAAAQSR